MKILNQISIKNLKMNRKRTISTIIAIMLSVALICAVAAMGTSFQATLVQNAINETGYYHIALMNLNQKDIETIRNNRDIKDTKIMYDMGYSYFNYDTEKDEYIHIYSLGNIVLKDLAYEIIEGKAPTNKNEIVISKSVASDSHYKVGDTVELEIGERKTLDNYALDETNPVNLKGEKLVDTVKKKYKIVGIVKSSSARCIYYGITTKDSSDKITAYCSFKNPKAHEENTAQLLGIKTINDYEEAKYNYQLNYELLRWEVFAVSDSTLSMLYAVVGVVMAIIIFTSVFCIRNSFAISTTEKTKMYGMLASVGATKKQIKKSVLFEGMILGLIGIPLGILAGIFAVFILIQIVNALIGNSLLDRIDGIIMKVTILPILVSILLGFITIYLSARSSAKRASKISPMEQLRSSKDIKINNKKLRTPKIIEKLFKTGGVLAYKNLKRSRKKYRTTVISLAVSIFVFITMNSFITNVFDFAGNYYRDYEYNVMLYGSNLNGLTKEDVQKIASFSGVEECYTIYGEQNHFLKITDESKVNKEDGFELYADNYFDTETGMVTLDKTGKKIIELDIKGLDDTSFRKYVKKLGIDYEKVKTSGILCDDYEYYNELTGITKTIRRYKYKKDDFIKGTFAGKEMEIKVGAISSTKPYGLEYHQYSGGYLIVNLDMYPNLGLQLNTVAIQSSKPEETISDIKNLYQSIEINNLDAQVKQQKSVLLVINIFLYGFIAVITLIGVTNIFNTITSNMELRQKEFAMLKSIGMTKKEFNRMINLETMFYGTKALLYGIILGLLGTFAVYRAFSVKIDNGINMYLPIIPIVISAIFVFVIVFVIMRYSIHKINKQNTIETIRKENV